MAAGVVALAAIGIVVGIVVLGGDSANEDPTPPASGSPAAASPTSAATVAPAPTATPAATVPPVPTMTATLAAAITTPTTTAVSPTPARPQPSTSPVANASEIPELPATNNLPGEGSAGVTGAFIPAVPDVLAGETLTWRAPEPPHPGYADRPFVLVDGETIAEPPAWGIDHAAALIDAWHDYHAALAGALRQSNFSLVAQHVSGERGSQISSVIRLLTSSDRAGHTLAHDRGMLVIDFRQGDTVTAQSYHWTHGYGYAVWLNETQEYLRPSRPPAFTIHLVGSWELVDGRWLLDQEYDPSRSLDYDGTAALFQDVAPQLLPYYELNARVRTDTGVLSMDDLIRANTQ